MKYLFFLVLLANIVFFLWEITNGTPQNVYPVRQHGASSVKEILLVSETKPKPEPETSGKDASADKYMDMAINQLPDDFHREDDNSVLGEQHPRNAGQTDLFCYEVGPFKNDEILQRWLDESGIQLDVVEVQNKEEDVQHGYVVFLPPEETYEQSKVHYDQLKRQGITDLWLFKKGESRGMISLGIYRNKQSGENIQRQFLSKGLDARIKPYHKREKRYFVKITSKQEINREWNISNDLENNEMQDLQIREEAFCAESNGEKEAAPGGIG